MDKPYIRSNSVSHFFFQYYPILHFNSIFHVHSLFCKRCKKSSASFKWPSTEFCFLFFCFLLPTHKTKSKWMKNMCFSGWCSVDLNGGFCKQNGILIWRFGAMLDGSSLLFFFYVSHYQFINFGLLWYITFFIGLRCEWILNIQHVLVYSTWKSFLFFSLFFTVFSCVCVCGL